MKPAVREWLWRWAPMLVIAGDLGIFYGVQYPLAETPRLAVNYAIRLGFVLTAWAALARGDPRWRAGVCGGRSPWRIPLGWTARFLLWLLLVSFLGGLAAGLVLDGLGVKLPVGLEGDPRDPVWLAWWLVGACVLVPAQEELVYRGFLLGPLLGAMRPWRVLLLSGVTFGLLHSVYGRGWATFPWYFAAGLIFGWAFLKTRCLGASILVHAVGNLLIGLKDLLIVHAPAVLRAIPGVEIVGPGH